MATTLHLIRRGELSLKEISDMADRRAQLKRREFVVVYLNHFGRYEIMTPIMAHHGHYEVIHRATPSVEATAIDLTCNATARNAFRVIEGGKGFDPRVNWPSKWSIRLFLIALAMCAALLYATGTIQRSF